jgi:hypothetical protein
MTRYIPAVWPIAQGEPGEPVIHITAADTPPDEPVIHITADESVARLRLAQAAKVIRLYGRR